jgi:dihydroxy-acid dehydratase
VALMTDGRFSGATHGFMIAHIVPEAADGGPIAALRPGDIINIDVKKRRLDMEVPATEIKKRLASWKAPKPRYTTGVFAKYATLVSDLGRGDKIRDTRRLHLRLSQRQINIWRSNISAYLHFSKGLRVALWTGLAVQGPQRR